MIKFTKKDSEVLVHAIMFNCFQSVEIKESGAALVKTESGPYLGFFVCGGKLRLRGQTPQTFTGISLIQTGFLVKHYVRKKN